MKGAFRFRLYKLALGASKFIPTGMGHIACGTIEARFRQNISSSNRGIFDAK